MAKTEIRAKDIDILIVNKYKLRSNIKSFNLSGMGCSAGLISIDLATDLLQVHPNSYDLVISTEIITPNYYQRSERAMLLPNYLFRMGGTVILLSKKPRETRCTKYKLVHVVRTHKGADDKAYKCVYEQEDPQGKIVIVGEALKLNITKIKRLQKKLQLSAEHVEASRMALHRFGNTSSSSL
ncbi:hypothetical protein ACS0TY_004613 [Phlomoides rotata]